ncbi:hypothetical protein D3C75_1284260 [compost metagenome]
MDGTEIVGRHVDALERQIALGIAKVLAELPDIVDSVLECIAQRVVGAIVELPVRITQVLMMGNITGR